MPHELGPYTYRQRSYTRPLQRRIANATGDVIADVWGDTQELAEGTVLMMIAACNACMEINPSNPVAVAEALPDVVAALRAFPRAGQANLCSTATQEERSAYISKVITWHNRVLVPALAAVEKGA
jgi:hypothetical protein